MTQAFNLSQLANNLNTSGQLDATDGLTGAVPVANGGTGLTSVGTSGNVLTSNGSVWTSTAPASPTIADGSITDAKISNGLTASTTYYPVFGTESFNSSGPSGLQRLMDIRCLRGGTYNIRFKIANFDFNEARTIGSRVYVDGVAVGSLISNVVQNGSYRTDTHTNITVTRGQIVSLYGSNSSGANDSVMITAPQIGSQSSISVNPFTIASNANSSQNTSGLPL